MKSPVHKLSALLACLGGIAGFLFQCVAHADDPRSYASFYVDTYGTADPKDPLVARSYRIFERLTQVADKSMIQTPGFRVIRSENRPWAIALPDGNIILSLGAINVCYGGVEQAEGDARLAFVLGHELTHLTAKHFWHRDAFLSLSGQQNPKVARLARAIGEPAGAVTADGEKQRQTVQERELMADDSGFLMASLAGFQTDLLIKEHSTDFFSHWVTQTQSYSDDLHVSPGERSEFLRLRLKNILAKKDYFDYGVRLLYFGRYRDAIYFFKEFQRNFPSKEVLGNLGYAHLQIARNLMGQHAFQYWLPTLYETDSQVLLHTRSASGSRKVSSEARKALLTAVEYLDSAARSNATHLPSRLNLAAAYLYLDEYHKARAVIEEAMKVAPDEPRARGLRAIILFEQEKEIDMWPVATDILEDMAKRANEPQPYVFNLARLYEMRGRSAQAQQYWLRLAKNSLELPDVYRDIVCQKTHKAGTCNLERVPEGSKDIAISLPLAPGTDIGSAKATPVLQAWKNDTRKLGPLRVDIFNGPGGDSMLALDHKIEMVVFNNSPLKTTQDLVSCCGPPVIKVSTANGEIWSYQQQWAVLVEAQRVKQLWLARSWP